MKKSMMSLLAASAFALAAPAGAVIIDGIILPGAPTPGVPYFQSGQVFEGFITCGGVACTPAALAAGGGQISGYGVINAINGNPNFCAAGPFLCELTYVFSGYVSKAGGTATDIDFTGGTVSFFADSSPEPFNPFSPDSAATDLANASDGLPFLVLSGHNFLDLISGRTGTLQATGTNLGSGTTDAGTGIGQLNVIGGDAAGLLNTNSVPDNLGGFSDLDLTTSFSNVGNPPQGVFNQDTGVAGPGLAGVISMAGVAVVPEPGSLALFGLGIAALAGVSGLRRKSII